MIGIRKMRKASKETLFVKYVRAKAKTQYHRYKKDECWVCKSEKDLELHHVYPLSDLIWEWVVKKGIKNPTNEPHIREELFNDVGAQIFNEENLITLCKVHHTNLHRLFGKTYGVKIVEKVKNYLTKQREKLNNG